MKITNNFINFQKKLVAKGNVLKNKKPVPCNIYELDYNEDKYYFGGPKQPERKYHILNLIDSALREYPSDFKKIYIIEDEKGTCLNAALVEEYTLCDNEIKYIQSVKDKKGYKYAGETMLTFLALKARLEGDDKLIVSSVLEKAIKFYKKCGLEIVEKEYPSSSDDYALAIKKLGLLLEQNQFHTGKKVELLA